MNKILIQFVLLSTCMLARSNQEPVDSSFFRMKEDSILVYLDHLNKNQVDSRKLYYNEKIKNSLKELLNQPGSFEYGFDTLKNIGKIASQDEKLRIYSWNVPFSNGRHLYSGFVQYKIDKDSVTIIELEDHSKDIQNPEFQKLSADNWFGALYYQIIEQKMDRKKYYVLLGFDINNLFTHKKLIDVLYFDETGQPFFGYPFFEKDDKMKFRVIFEYSARVMMSLNYDENLDMIVFDHLSPFDSRYKGNYQFYGPDFSYDAFEFEKDKWIFKSNVDARNQP